MRWPKFPRRGVSRAKLKNKSYTDVPFSLEDQITLKDMLVISPNINFGVDLNISAENKERQILIQLAYFSSLRNSVSDYNDYVISKNMTCADLVQFAIQNQIFKKELEVDGVRPEETEGQWRVCVLDIDNDQKIVECLKDAQQITIAHSKSKRQKLRMEVYPHRILAIPPEKQITLLCYLKLKSGDCIDHPFLIIVSLDDYVHYIKKLILDTLKGKHLSFEGKPVSDFADDRLKITILPPSRSSQGTKQQLEGGTLNLTVKQLMQDSDFMKKQTTLNAELLFTQLSAATNKLKPMQIKTD